MYGGRPTFPARVTRLKYGEAEQRISSWPTRELVNAWSECNADRLKTLWEDHLVNGLGALCIFGGEVVVHPTQRNNVNF